MPAVIASGICSRRRITRQTSAAWRAGTSSFADGSPMRGRA
jgi:hypothetical protein